MEREYKSITELPAILEVSDGDKLLVHHNGRAYQVDAVRFHGTNATINGEPAIEIEAGENITLTQYGTTITISADGAINTVKVNGTALSIVQKAVDILIASGTADGTISVNGADVSVTGLGAALTALSTLIGTDANKSVRSIALEELAAQLIPEDAQAAMDTLQEIAAWIQGHPDDAAAINAKLTLGTHEVDGQQVQYATVKAYVEAMVTGLITLASLSASVTGAGNAITGVSYDNITGAFAFTKGTTFLTQHQDISGKVDKVTGKGLSTNDYTNADKAKLDSISLPAGGVSLPVILADQSVANFTSNAAGRPLRVTANIQPVQAAGTPSPSNPLPISGWTGAVVRRWTGKNLLPLLAENPFISSNQFNVATYSVPNGTITLSCTANTAAGAMIDISPPFFTMGLVHGQSYIITGSTGSNVIYLTIRGSATSGSVQHVTTEAGVSITYDAGTMRQWRLAVRVGNNTDTTTTVTTTPMIRAASDSAAFEPYNGQSVPIAFPAAAGTVYGGTLDAARGLLTVTHIKYTPPLSAFSPNGGTPREGNRWFYDYTWSTDIYDIDFAKTRRGNFMCNNTPARDGDALWVSGVGIALYRTTPTGSVTVRIYDTESITISALAEKYNGLYVVCPLATTVTYQLTPQQLVTLAGTNNVFADCGPVTVTHWPGTGTPVEPVEDASEIEWKKGILDRIAALEGG